MYNTNLTASYSLAVFLVVLISGCVLNLLKRHFIYQLTGIAFFFTYSIFMLMNVFKSRYDISPSEVYFSILPSLMGVSACLISMVLGFWLFPPIRKRFRD